MPAALSCRLDLLAPCATDNRSFREQECPTSDVNSKERDKIDGEVPDGRRRENGARDKTANPNAIDIPM
jgi:hypothetical protein